MFFSELTSEQRRRLIDIQQIAQALRVAETDMRLRFSGSMSWKRRGERDYLYRRGLVADKSLGPRSTQTEATYQAFTAGRKNTAQRVSTLRQTLEDMAPVNRAMGLGRVPRLVSRILRRLDMAGLLGDQVCVVGTNALFAYEAVSGLQFTTGLLATNDLDIALDARKNLALAGRLMPAGLIGVLQQVDHSFSLITPGHYRAVNGTGMMVDLITPQPRNPMQTVAARKRTLGGSPAPAMGDVVAAEIPRLEMIVDAPRTTSIAVAEDGLPVRISAADPRWWAAHKLWLAREPQRDPLKRRRDHGQGIAVARMLAKHWPSPDISDAALASLPLVLRSALRDAIQQQPEPDSATQW
jgi:hypothetical protein